MLARRSGCAMVHPDAAHPLLLRLGAAEATPRTVLEDPLTRAAVSESIDSADAEPVAQAVLALVDAARLTAGEAPWLADLALRGADGELYPAGELLLAEGALAGLLDPDDALRRGRARAGGDGTARGCWPPRECSTASPWCNDSDVLLDPDDCDHDLDGEDEWLEAVLDLLPELDVPPVAPGSSPRSATWSTSPTGPPRSRC